MSQETHTTQRRSSPGAVHTGHPTPATYFKVAMTLAALTAMEVAVFFATWLGHGIIPILAILSGVKFALVVMFYMHLKFDHPAFSWLFVLGLSIAAALLVALMLLFDAVKRFHTT